MLPFVNRFQILNLGMRTFLNSSKIYEGLCLPGDKLSSDSQRSQVTRKIWSGNRRSSLAQPHPSAARPASSPVSSERLMASRPNADLVSTHSTPPTASCFPTPVHSPQPTSRSPVDSPLRSPFPLALPFSPRPKLTSPRLLSPPSPPARCPIDRVRRMAPRPAPCSQRLPQPRHCPDSHFECL